MHRSVASVVAAGLVCLPLLHAEPGHAGPIHAAPAGPSKAATPTPAAPKERARELFTRGQAAYTAGDYAGALALFEQAYATFPAPALFFNIAQCHRKLKATARALDALQRYLEEDKKIPAQLRAEVDSQIAEAQALIEEEARQATAAGAATAERTGPTVATSPSSVEVTSPADEPDPLLNPVVLGAVAGGVTVVGAAIVVLALLSGPPSSTTGASLGTVDLR